MAKRGFQEVQARMLTDRLTATTIMAGGEARKAALDGVDGLELAERDILMKLPIWIPDDVNDQAIADFAVRLEVARLTLYPEARQRPLLKRLIGGVIRSRFLRKP